MKCIQEAFKGRNVFQNHAMAYLLAPYYVFALNPLLIFSSPGPSAELSLDYLTSNSLNSNLYWRYLFHDSKSKLQNAVLSKLFCKCQVLVLSVNLLILSWHFRKCFYLIYDWYSAKRKLNICEYKFPLGYSKAISLLQA